MAKIGDNILKPLNDKMDDLITLRKKKREQNSIWGDQERKLKQEIKKEFLIPIAVQNEVLKLEEMDEGTRMQLESSRSELKAFRGLPLFDNITQSKAENNMRRLIEDARKRKEEEQEAA